MVMTGVACVCVYMCVCVYIYIYTPVESSLVLNPPQLRARSRCVHRQVLLDFVFASALCFVFFLLLFHEGVYACISVWVYWCAWEYGCMDVCGCMGVWAYGVCVCVYVCVCVSGGDLY